MNQTEALTRPPENKWLILAAWLSLLLISDLPDIVWTYLSGPLPPWLAGAKTAAIAAFLLLCLAWSALRPLWRFALVMLVFCLALRLSAWVREAAWFQDRFLGPSPSFSTGYLGVYILDLGVAAGVIAALWLVKRHRREFFLVKGQPGAPIGPVRWLGIRPGQSWRTFGWIFAGVAGLGVLIPTALEVQPSLDLLGRAWPLLPFVLLFAAVNAFTEEVYFRLSLLATLTDIVGKNHALLLNVVFFGLAHYLHGSPPGIMGFLMTGFLAWLLGKSILETRGLLWAWFIHFVPDVVIFAFYAILYVKA
ncbi:MAG: CPBP family intramembrane metalloprotease [Acidobacteria bacterium]|nr:CPBP family intramembrane metalloprotease [Acidobacteriota bacterium]